MTATPPVSPRGTEALAARLYVENAERLLAMARRNCASVEDAEEALQDALVLFIERFDLGCGAPPLPWLMLTLKRRCWAIYGRRRELGELLARAGEEQMALRAPCTVEELAELREQATILGQEIRRLRPQEREALTLLVGGYSYREIAERSGSTPKRVDHRLERARAKLREAAKGDQSPAG